jgi:uncharacterized iron-regulated protein
MKNLMVILATVLISLLAQAQQEGIFNGTTLSGTSIENALKSVGPGSIVIVGENHGFKEHQAQQIEIMSFLRAKGLKVSVGMEFFTYTEQNLLDDYRAGKLSEVDFLKEIKWGGTPFDFYRTQALFANAKDGSTTIALNAPRFLTSKVSKAGLQSLTPQEMAILPPSFSLGRDSYKQRFLDLMGQHLPSPQAGERYFAAQSIWDDTMAWQASSFIEKNNDQVLVIVVGEFHVQFGGGLPDRIHSRSPQIPIVTFSQINTLGLSDQEIDLEKGPSSVYGPRADYLWLAPAQ